MHRSGRGWGNLWRLRWLLLCNLFLLSPLAFYELQLTRGLQARPDKILVFALPASLLWLALLHLLVRRPFALHALLAPVYVLVATDLYVILHYDTRLASSMLLVLVENLADAGAFIRVSLTPLLVTAALFVPLYVLALLKLRGLRTERRPGLALVCAGLLVGLYAGITAIKTRKDGFDSAWKDVIGHDRNSPFAIVPQSFTAYLVHREIQEGRKLAEGFRFGATRKSPLAGREVYVLVIGESSRPDHWGLYGYPRQTTPRLAAEKNLVVFRDVLAQAALTQIAVPLLITRATITDREVARRERSLLSAYGEAGFTTAWLSTVQRDQWTGQINLYTPEATVQRFFERRHDGVLVEALRDVLSGTPASQPLFVVLHTQGSHFVFSDRYPRGFARFEGGSSPRDRLVDSYDNSILYTDHVVAEVVALLKAEQATSAMLYVADHGENLDDDARHLIGHFFNNEYDLPVPMLLWYSERWAQRFPERVAAARLNAEKPISTTTVFHTLAELGDLVLPGASPARSLLRAEFESGPRFVLRGVDGLGDGDELLSNRKAGGAGAQRTGAATP